MPVSHRESYLGSLSEEALISLRGFEGLPPPRVAPARAADPRLGYLLAGMTAAIAYGLHASVKQPLGSAMLAMLVGLAISNLLPLPSSVAAGAKNLVRILPVAIILMGAGLNLTQVAAVSLAALGIIVICIALTMTVTCYVGRFFGLRTATSVLIAAGTAICGTNAIVAVAPLVSAEDDDLMLSIATVNLVGLGAMFSLPFLGDPLGLTAQEFGIWTGTAIQTFAQVAAAGFAYSQSANAVATLVKLVRVTFLVPLVVVLTAIYARRRTKTEMGVRYSRLIPVFVWGFVAAAALNTLGLLPILQFQRILGTAGPLTVPSSGLLTQAGNLVLTLAMAGMGLEVNLRLVAKVGARSVLTGAVASVLLAVASLGLIRLLV